MEVTPDLLSAFPLLNPLSSDTLKDLASASRAEKYARRGIVLEPEDDQKSICFLFEGRLQGVDFTVDGREVGLYFVNVGDFCGETALFDELPRPEYVVALSKSLVIKVPAPKLEEIMLQTPSVMNSLGIKLASRVRQLTLQRSLLAISNVQQRVCCQLWALCKESLGKSEIEILSPPTHLEIANMLSISRESVTRVFQTLQNRQIVRRNGSSSLLIVAPDILQGMAEGSEDFEVE